MPNTINFSSIERGTNTSLRIVLFEVKKLNKPEMRELFGMGRI